MQWREKVVEPAFESKTDYAIFKLLSDKLGFGKEMFKHIKAQVDEASMQLAIALRRIWSIWCSRKFLMHSAALSRLAGLVIHVSAAICAALL